MGPCEAGRSLDADAMERLRVATYTASHEDPRFFALSGRDARVHGHCYHYADRVSRDALLARGFSGMRWEAANGFDERIQA